MPLSRTRVAFVLRTVPETIGEIQHDRVLAENYSAALLALPVGWAKQAAPAEGQEHHKRAGKTGR